MAHRHAAVLVNTRTDLIRKAYLDVRARLHPLHGDHDHGLGPNPGSKMPLINFHLIEGRSPGELRNLLDTAHGAMVEAFEVPPKDRYQIVHEHPETHLVVEDTGLNIPRTRNRVLLQVITRPRTSEMKQTFYRLLCERLRATCGIEPSDVIVSLVTSGDEDWSFGQGRAQFLTGEL